MNSRSFTVDWVARHAANWKRVLAPFVGIPGITALEIGSFEGRSACWWLDNILTGDGAVLHCVDPWQPTHLAGSGPSAESRFRANTAGYGDRLVVHKLGSFDYAIRALNRSPREQHAFIYLDGSHEAADVIADLVLLWPLLAPGGVLICDDYRHQRPFHLRVHPSVAIDGFFACRLDCEQLVSGYQWIVRKTC